MIRVFAIVALLAAISPLAARDSLGVYDQWAAFRDPETPRCYAIAKARGDSGAFATIGTWPKNGVRGQVHIRLSRPAKSARLAIGNRRFDLKPIGSNAWAADKAMDAAIVAAMRSSSGMSISARAANGTRFTDRYSLDGAATAMDAAIVGCAQLG